MCEDTLSFSMRRYNDCSDIPRGYKAIVLDMDSLIKRDHIYWRSSIIVNHYDFTNLFKLCLRKEKYQLILYSRYLDENDTSKQYLMSFILQQLELFIEKDTISSHRLKTYNLDYLLKRILWTSVRIPDYSYISFRKLRP